MEMMGYHGLVNPVSASTKKYLIKDFRILEQLKIGLRPLWTYPLVSYKQGK